MRVFGVNALELTPFLILASQPLLEKRSAPLRMASWSKRVRRS